jgi:phosphate butyryltransferase
VPDITSFDEMFRVCKAAGPSMVAVAGAEPNVISAMREAEEYVDAVFVGEGEDIERAVEELGVDMDACGFRILDVPGADPEDVARAAINEVRGGRADMLMKGLVPTSTLMHAVLDKDNGLRPDRDGALLSHVACFEVPTYKKLLFGTDGGIVIRPDLDQKIEILENALFIVRSLGIKSPRVAPLTAVEKVNPKMPETVDADELRKMGAEGYFGDAVVAGPTAFDVAVSAEAAEKKGLDSPVAGETDILLFPEIVAGNATIKALMYLAGAKVGGLVAGALAPIILLSRADSREDRLNSIVFCKAVVHEAVG